MTTRRRRTNSNSENEHVESTRLISQSTSSVSRTLVSVNQDMNCRDRTQEFISVIKSLQSRQLNGTISKPSQKSAAGSRTEFMVIAKKIGRDLANTYAKLEKLTMLARRKSLFDDKPAEIQQLTYMIKQDLGALNTQIAHLQELSKTQKSRSSHHLQTHSNSVVVALQSRLATMSGDFKSVLEVRTENLKQQKCRRDEFSQEHVSPSLPSAALDGNLGSVLLHDEATRGQGDPDIVINMDSAHRSQQQLQLIDEQDTYIQSRADTMKNIEQTIVELGSIFQQLAHMVQEQEETVARIDSNIEQTTLNIEAAHSEIVKYFQSVTSNRWLMIKIFGVLVIFFIIFIVFLA